MKKKNNKSKLKIKNWILILIGLIITTLIISFIIFVIINKKVDINDNKIDNTVEKIEQMNNYEYYLDENATEYYKQLYNELKDVLNGENLIDEEYAKVISKLFVTDLFTLENKITSSDIGGLQFIFAGFKEDFVNIAKTTLYSSVKSNIYGDRKQELPIVTNVEINSMVSSSFTYQNNEYNSYNITLNIAYQKDLGYPTKYNLVLIKNDKYWQVVSGE